MVNSIAGVAGFMRFYPVSDTQLPGQRGQLFIRAGHSDKVGMEILYVLFQFLRRVPFRVYRNEQDLVGFCFTSQVLLQSVVDRLQIKKGAGADIRAMRETKEKK